MQFLFLNTLSSRNVLGLKNANSTESDPDCGDPVVIDMPEHNQGQLGGTMRLGRRQTVFQDAHKHSVLSNLSTTHHTIYNFNSP